MLFKNTFSEYGISSYRENLSQKITVIDENILRYGSINFLGFTDIEECCVKIVDNKIESEIEAEVIG